VATTGNRYAGLVLNGFEDDNTTGWHRRAGRSGVGRGWHPRTTTAPCRYGATRERLMINAENG
jgi:hypothetical protein